MSVVPGPPQKTTIFAMSALSIAVVSCFGTAAGAQELKTLYSFCSKDGCADGQTPYDALVPDSAGNLYGSANRGGKYGYGTIVELKRDGKTGKRTFRQLYSFCATGGCPDGADPLGPLILDASGNLYGSTFTGGTGSGTVFELLAPRRGKPWKLKQLHSFGGTGDGSLPWRGGLTYAHAAAGIPYDGVSPLYGTTEQGGAHGGGTAFELSPRSGGRKWTENVIYSFCSLPNCADGEYPLGGLVFDPAGNLYGTTSDRGTRFQAGTIFELSPKRHMTQWTWTALYSFCLDDGCATGASPQNSLIIDSSGKLYGTAMLGGLYGYGAVFSLVPAGTRSQLAVLYNMCSEEGCADGISPQSALVMDAEDNLYGTAEVSEHGGTVFKLNGSFTVLHDFSGSDGFLPYSSLILDAPGTLYGTTAQGGANNGGTIFEITP